MPVLPRLTRWTMRGLTHCSCLRGSGARGPACPLLHTLQSRGPACSENKKGPLKPLTICLRSVWRRHHPTCAQAALGLGPRSAAMSVRCPRKCIGRRVAPPRLLAECPRTSQCRAPQDPLPAERPGPSLQPPGDDLERPFPPRGAGPHRGQED